MPSLRTRPSEANCIGSARDSSDFLRRSVDLEVVFAFAETEKSFGQDRSRRNHQAGQRTEAPAASSLFQRIRGAPGRLKEAIRTRCAARAALERRMALGSSRYSRVRTDGRLAGRSEIQSGLRQEFLPAPRLDGAARL